MDVKNLSVALLMVSLLVLTAGAQVPDDGLIVPGQRIGKWTLQMTIAELVKINGPQNIPPDAPRSGSPIDPMSRWARDSNEEIWWHWWSNLFFSAATRGRDGQRVEYIFTQSGDFKTDKDIACGMAREEIEKAYGPPTKVTTGAGTGQAARRQRLIYDDIGLAAVIDGNGVIAFLYVFRPKTASTLWNF